MATGVLFVGIIFTPWGVAVGLVALAAPLVLWFWPRHPHRDELVEEQP
jgi:hypothetical protein